MLTTTAPALRLDGLTKTYSGKTAADQVCLTVPTGSLTGLVGPNGAGKTTSLAMTVGLLRPDSGTAVVHGVDVWAEPAKAKAMLGVLPDGLALPERLTGAELLTDLRRRLAPSVVRSGDARGGAPQRRGGGLARRCHRDPQAGDAAARDVRQAPANLTDRTHCSGRPWRTGVRSTRIARCATARRST
ncbi:ATP-binding cassette domain-containing protein [Amycolatopsis sp. cmx-11-12]|uniref:ATP-binding cassette domain-containing protein n=1 Tax=Amycolatopsis sp. cmx-11-12 TaxID=2785795 RepID=UPI003917495A